MRNGHFIIRKQVDLSNIICLFFILLLSSADIIKAQGPGIRIVNAMTKFNMV